LSRLATRLVVLFLPVAPACLVYTAGTDLPEPAAEHRVERSTPQRGTSRETTWKVQADGGQVRDGPERERAEDGTLLAERLFQAGRPAGTWRTWYRDGSPRSQIELGDGTTLGWHRFWHPGGILAAEGQARGEVREGPWQFWDAEGNLERAGPFVGGRRHGWWTLWEGGRKVAEGRYEHGARSGSWTLWDEQGEAHVRGAIEDGSAY
jgi:antitoxin component YwqK of YwqJK toxin-antitoxin module